jgi:hypothetical protein
VPFAFYPKILKSKITNKKEKIFLYLSEQKKVDCGNIFEAYQYKAVNQTKQKIPSKRNIRYYITIYNKFYYIYWVPGI